MTNAYKRTEDIKQGTNLGDMAEGFDETLTDEFINFIKNFEKDTMPRIEEILKSYYDKKVKIINKYIELEDFIDAIKEKYDRVYR